MPFEAEAVIGLPPREMFDFRRPDARSLRIDLDRFRLPPAPFRPFDAPFFSDPRRLRARPLLRPLRPLPRLPLLLDFLDLLEPSRSLLGPSWLLGSGSRCALKLPPARPVLAPDLTRIEPFGDRFDFALLMLFLESDLFRYRQISKPTPPSTIKTRTTNTPTRAPTLLLPLVDGWS